MTRGHRVYDVTDFAPIHPGGAALIAMNVGKDVSAAMRDRRSHAHSRAAYDALDKYLISDAREGKSSEVNGTGQVGPPTRPDR